MEVYRLIVLSDTNIINSSHDEVADASLHPDLKVDTETDSPCAEKKCFDPATCVKSSGDPGLCLQGCSLLHLACNIGNPVMLELLLQSGADINKRDFHGRTPLQHCISQRNNNLAKLLLRR